MSNDKNYAVGDLVVRESPMLSRTGQTSATTTVTFLVGAHGPFTLTYAGSRPNSAQIAQDVTAKVNEIRALDSALAQLNQSTG